MIECLPIGAAAENWIHDVVCRKLNNAVSSIAGGMPVPAWSDGLPPELRRQRALRRCYEQLCALASTQSQELRASLVQAIQTQNAIPAIFDPMTPFTSTTIFPATLQVALKDYFRAAFDVLGPLGVRDRQYALVYELLASKTCPFCGVELMDAPGLPREDLDHYLPIAKYPFAGVNLRNLAPMGAKCNSSYKLQKDVLHDDLGHRRRCFDPYGERVGKISLRESRMFAGDVRDSFRLPAWEVELQSEQMEETETWDAVFRIKERYRRSVLDAFFREWIQHFRYWCIRSAEQVFTVEELVTALRQYQFAVVQEAEAQGLFLRRAMFDMLEHKCSQAANNERLVAWMLTFINAED